MVDKSYKMLEKITKIFFKIGHEGWTKWAWGHKGNFDGHICMDH